METNNLPAISPLTDLNVPHMDQYFGVWVMKEDVLKQAVNRANGMNLKVHVESARGEQAAEPNAAVRSDFPVHKGGIAQVTISGTMMKFSSSMSSSTSTVRARRQIRAAANDEEVQAILLSIDSPGGTVSGTKDLADDIAAAAKRKPVYAFIEDLGASAAYWVASQATKVYSNETALVGSIGVFSTIYDYSKQAEELGIKVHVVRAGQHKGAGVPGTEVTEEQLAEWQSIVDTYYDHFVNAVATGRAMNASQARQLADGRVHIGKAAHDLGLTDGVRTYDEVLAEMRSGGGSRRAQAADTTQKESKPMSKSTDTNETTATAASVKELRAACPKADEKFLLEQLEQNATLEAAQQNYIQHLEASHETLATENQTLKAEKEEQEKEAAKSKDAKTGVGALGNGKASAAGDDDGDPAAAWKAAINENVAKGMSRERATMEANRQNPGLREAMLAAASSSK
ncbi:Putative signal peptide peptidase SppA [Polystyrenella longa]|uniref:Signal peptide peptidase SppA n=1 Tax=Polystyrenella longa TaxID=2528007 RepID=A0A518CTY4_9PLAN|nr:signal peptide peptidase SppA [Polystyrenella longa]QDU82671.1 Putative signal peptide peptidase SppA [Polystyrenella longa]